MSSQKKTSFSLLFYPSKTKLKKNGEAPVLMKININGNRIVLNTKRSVNPTAWNSVKGRMGGRTQEAKEFNDYIDAIILRTRQKYSELLTQHDGWRIRTKRQKTGGMTNVPLLQKPVQILLKYSDFEFLQDDDPVLPMLSNQKMNAYLKELADLCGITKPLSFHTARHTFATTVTMMNGVPMESVSKMLGHKNLKSTQHYARIVNQKVGQDMAALAQKLNASKKFSY